VIACNYRLLVVKMDHSLHRNEWVVYFCIDIILFVKIVDFLLHKLYDLAEVVAASVSYLFVRVSSVYDHELVLCAVVIEVRNAIKTKMNINITLVTNLK